MPNTSSKSATASVENRIIFGPIHSRRFGVSLGIDLSSSHKQCNFDCLYCELAPAVTVDHQNDTVAVDAILEALEAALKLHPHIDVITLTANGEPTLYPHLEQLIERIKALHVNIDLLILTNSATLGHADTFRTLLKLDQVKLSLDAVSSDIFKKIDRPHPGIDIHDIALHVKEFSQQFQGKLFIEILFVKGLNDTPEEIQKLNDTLLHVNAARIDIGTVDRPPAYPVEALDFEALHRIARQFDPSLPIHIASRHTASIVAESYSEEEILNTLDKRPLTREDMQLLFDSTTLERLEQLIRNEKITTQNLGGVTFYLPTNNLHRKRRKS